MAVTGTEELCNAQIRLADPNEKGKVPGAAMRRMHAASINNGLIDEP
jgi:hypothetical protein